jgi:hypothetical protein
MLVLAVFEEVGDGEAGSHGGADLSGSGVRLQSCVGLSASGAHLLTDGERSTAV